MSCGAMVDTRQGFLQSDRRTSFDEKYKDVWGPNSRKRDDGDSAFTVGTIHASKCKFERCNTEVQRDFLRNQTFRSPDTSEMSRTPSILSAI